MLPICYFIDLFWNKERLRPTQGAAKRRKERVPKMERISSTTGIKLILIERGNYIREREKEPK